MTDPNFTPPWQDMATLCRNICVSTTTVDNWVAQGVLPPPRKRGGKLMWKWSEVDDAMRGNIYFVESGDLIKIGFTTNVKQRTASLAGSSGAAMRTLLIIHGTKRLEKRLHIKFWKCRDHGEWFRKEARLLAYIEGLRGANCNLDYIECIQAGAE